MNILHRLGRVSVLLLLVCAGLIVAGCRSGAENPAPGAQSATTPVPTIAPPPTVNPPSLTQGTPGATGATSAGGSINGRSYVGEVRIRQQVTISPKNTARVEELRVDVGDRVKAGDVVAVMEHSTQDAALAQAQAQLQVAQANLALLRAPARQVDVAQAQAAVRVAQANLERLQAGATAEDRETARLRIEQAKNQLWSLQGQRDGVCGQAAELRHTKGADVQAAQATGQCDSFRGQVQAAEAAVQIAEQNYQRLISGATEAEINVAQANIDQALAGVARAQTGSIPQQIAVAQAQVAAAQTAVDAAQLNVDEATIVAPFDGVVSVRNATVGAWVGAGGGQGNGLLTLISQATDVTFDVETALVGQVEVGGPVKISVDTYSGVSFKGKITRVAPTGDTSTRTFRVTAEPDDPEGKLKPGMFANVVVGGR